MTSVSYPKQWKATTLGRVITLLSGQHINVDDCNTDGIGTPYLTGPADFDNGSIRCTKYTQSPQVCCEPGDILLTVKGSGTGTTAVAESRYCISRQLMAVRPRNADPIYIRFVLESHAAIYNRVSAGLIPGIARDDVLNTRIGIPPISEQRVIGQVLMAWDAAIEKTEQLIAAKEKRLQSATTSLYTSSTQKGTHSHFGDFLKESSLVGTNGRHAMKLSIKLYGKGVLPKDDKRIGSEQTQYFVRRSGQLVYSKLDFLNGAFGIVPAELDGFESTLDLPAFDIDDSVVDPQWLLGYLTRPIYYTRQIGLARGQRKARRVHPSDFLASPLQLPSLDVQRQVAATLRTLKQDI